MADNNQTNQDSKGRELTDAEAKKLKIGLDLKETTSTAGWKVIEGWLKSRAFHSWVDPRGLSKKEWEWAELNAYHSHDVAIEILKEIEEAKKDADELQDIKMGRNQPERPRL